MKPAHKVSSAGNPVASAENLSSPPKQLCAILSIGVIIPSRPPKCSAFCRCSASAAAPSKTKKEKTAGEHRSSHLKSMILYHGSNTGNLKLLEPRQADHDRPYVYMTTIDVVAAFYLCNAVEKPYYWFPYGFEQGGSIPIYHELYPNALKEVSEGVSGYLYEVCAEEPQILPFKNIPCARLAASPVKVSRSIRIENAYDLFLDYVRQGKMKIGYFHEKTEKQLEWWYAGLTSYLEEKAMVKTPDCSYALFIQKKFPQVWENYITQEKQKTEGDSL